LVKRRSRLYRRLARRPVTRHDAGKASLRSRSTTGFAIPVGPD
jgi:hypothetical protein